MNRYAPIAVFAYNRPDHLRQTLEHLSKNPEAAESTLYVFCDGPKASASEDQRNAIAEVARVAGERKWCGEVIVRASETNKGLAASVIDGVTQVVEQHGSVILLEDDALCAPFFLAYMNAALDKYKNDDRVISIAGFIYPVKRKLPDTFFLLGADCIAWATWKRGWDLFEHDGRKLLDLLERSGKQHHFDFGGTYPYTQMLRDQIEGKNDSWAIRWYASAYLAGKFTLYPGRPVIANIGFDGSGINSGTSDKWTVNLTDRPLAVETIPVEDHAEARKAFAEFFTEMRKTPFTTRVKEAIWSRLPGFIRKAWSGKSDAETYGWHGNYASWSEAQANSTGYDAGAIADKVFGAAQQVKDGKAFCDRDGMLFDKAEGPAAPLIELKNIAKSHGNKLSVVDFGGGPGSTFFLSRKLLPEVEWKWHVIEQPHYAARGNISLAGNGLKFYSEINEESCSGMQVLMLLSVLHYIEDPEAIVRELLKFDFERIIIETTPMVDKGEAMITVQRVPPVIYEASYPCHIFNENEFLSWFKGYTVRDKYPGNAVEPRIVEGRMVEWRGYILEKNK